MKTKIPGKYWTSRINTNKQQHILGLLEVDCGKHKNMSTTILKTLGRQMRQITSNHTTHSKSKAYFRTL